MVYSGDVGWSQGVSPMHHGRSGGADGEPVSAAENRCLDLQENLVEAIERAAAALRVVHDESQSRELRSLITIRRVTGETSLSKERTDDLLNQLANLAQCRGDTGPTLQRLERARLDLVTTIHEEMPFIIFEQSLVQEALIFATLSDGVSEPGTPAPQRASGGVAAAREKRDGPVSYGYDTMQTPSTATADSSPEFRESPTSVIPMHRDHRDEGARKTKAVAFASTTEELGRSGGGILIPPPPLFFPPGSAETQTQAEFRRGYGGTPGSEKLADEEWPDREYAAQPDLEAQRSRSGGGLLPHVAAAAAVAAAGVGAFLLRHRVAEGASAVAGAMGARASEMMAARAADRSRGSAAREGKAEETRRQRAQADAARRERAAARAEQKKRADLAKAAQREAEAAAASLVAEQRAIAEHAAAAKRAAAERKQRALADATAAAKAAASPASPAPPPRPAPAAPARAPLGDVTNTVAQAAAPPPKGPVRSSPAPVSPLAAASPPAPPPAPVRAKVQPPLAPEAAPAPLRRPAEYLSGLEGGAHALVEVRWTPHVSLGRG